MAVRPRSLVRARGRLVLLAVLAAFAMALISAPAPRAVALSVNINPREGPAGTQITISGNLIGCYGSGPGIESSTWGLPEKLDIQWDDEVGNVSVDQSQQGKKLKTVATYAFGDAGFKVTFAAPSGKPGPHAVLATFTPQCNYKSLDKNGKEVQDRKSASYAVSFCLKPDANTACFTSLGSGAGQKDPNVVKGPGIDSLPTGNLEYTVAMTSTGLIVLLVGATVVAWWTGGTVLGTIGGWLGIGRGGQKALEAGQKVKQLTDTAGKLKNAEEMNKAYRAARMLNKAREYAQRLYKLTEGTAEYEAVLNEACGELGINAGQFWSLVSQLPK